MPLSTIFAALTVATGAELDLVLAELGVLTTIPCSVAGTNALALAPGPLTPTVVAYEDFQGFSCVAVATNTGAVVATIGALATLNVYKDTPVGPALLTAGDIVIGNLLILYYDPALDSGSGGFHLGGPCANANAAIAASVLVEGGAAEKISAMTAVAIPPPAMPFVTFQVTGDATKNYKSPMSTAMVMPSAAGVQPNVGILSGRNTNASGNGADMVVGAESGTGPTGTGGNVVLQTANAPIGSVAPGDILVVLSTGGTRVGFVKVQDSTGTAVLPAADPGVVNALYRDASGFVKISL